MENGAVLEVNYSDILPFDVVSIHNVEVKTPLEARNFGGALFSVFKNRVKKLKIDISSEFSNDILEGVELAAYEFNKYKSVSKPAKLKALRFQAFQPLLVTFLKV